MGLTVQPCHVAAPPATCPRPGLLQEPPATGHPIVHTRHHCRASVGFRSSVPGNRGRDQIHISLIMSQLISSCVTAVCKTKSCTSNRGCKAFTAPRKLFKTASRELFREMTVDRERNVYLHFKNSLAPFSRLKFKDVKRTLLKRTSAVRSHGQACLSCSFLSTQAHLE